MTYTISIDQSFAQANNLTLTQVATLAAFITLPTWTKNIAIDGHVWYMYSENKMAEDFPLLFGVPKRCYKNINELAELGFVQLTKLGRDKYVRFTERCSEWGKGKDQFCTSSPKTDEIKSENGQNKSPKMDANYIIKNNQDIKTINTADGGLFPGEPEKEVKPRGTAENLCLFANSRYSDYETFASCFQKDEFANIDIAYYFNAVADWSAQKGKKMKDWIATARNFMRSDVERNKLHTLDASNVGFNYESAKAYLEMCSE